MHCGWGCDESNNKNGPLTDVENGLFQWSNEVLDNLKNTNFVCPSLKSRQLHMISHMMELLHDLMTSPSANVSRSPGFKLLLGIFGGCDSDATTNYQHSR